MASHNRTTASEINLKVDDIPTVPTIGTATAGGGSASVAFTASTKGGTASTYTALSNPGSVTASGASSPVTVSGLTAGTAYTFTVRGNNATGSSEYSSASNSVTPTVNTSYESIATVTVGSGGSSSIDFTSISSSYTHLQIRLIAQKLTSSTNGLMRFNSDATGTNYYAHGIEANGSSLTGSAFATNDFPRAVANVPTTANIFAVSIVDILDYANTNKYKTVRSLNGYDANGSGILTYSSGLWKNTAAITDIKIYPTSGNFAQYSSFALYGIKGV